jgi:hypothetical protein
MAADDHAYRFTVAQKNGTSAETYGEPQTPSTVSRLHFPQNFQSLAQPPTSRNGLYFTWGISLRSIYFRVNAALGAKNFESAMPERRHALRATRIAKPHGTSRGKNHDGMDLGAQRHRRLGASTRGKYKDTFFLKRKRNPSEFNSGSLFGAALLHGFSCCHERERQSFLRDLRHKRTDHPSKPRRDVPR